MKEVRIHRDGRETTDVVAEERELVVRINGKLVADLMMSPGFEKEGVLGFLSGEGMIKSLEEIEELEIKGGEARVTLPGNLASRCLRYLSSDCMGGWRARVKAEDIQVISDRTVTSREITDNMKRLQKESPLWNKTGGVHSSVLVWDDDFTVMEDVSRHVTIDKVIGRGLLEGADFGNSYILTSGRLPGDMVIKAARMGIPIVASRTAPVYSGVQCAEETGLTLVGFVRGGRMNIYTGGHRIQQENLI